MKRQGIVSMVEDTPLVSIIATFYNLERYVDRCVNSILFQKGATKYEAILIDDGSTDSTGAILDGFATDSRVRIEHTKNSGVAAARNLGVELARAPYVTFVDGDDYVSPYYVELLCKSQHATGCDLIVAKHEVVKDSALFSSWKDDGDTVILDNETALEKLMYEQVTESPWAKLGARDIYLKEPFPNGRMYEDVAVAADHYLAAGGVAALNVPVYAYVMRSGSVVHKKRASTKQIDDFIWASNRLTQSTLEAYPQIKDACSYRESLELMRIWSLGSTLQDSEKKKECQGMILSRLRSLAPIVLGDMKAPLRNKIRLNLLIHVPYAYDLAFSVYELVRKGVRRLS